jgi:putative membrane protein
MPLATNILITFIALLHIYFLVLEMFLWDKPLGMKTFGLSKEFAAASKVLAANQGLYNGFLAAGLLWGLSSGANSFYIKVFFLSCILIAGIYGAYSTGRKKILYIQAVPAAIALVLLHL